MSDVMFKRCCRRGFCLSKLAPVVRPSPPLRLDPVFLVVAAKRRTFTLCHQTPQGRVYSGLYEVSGPGKGRDPGRSADV